MSVRTHDSLRYDFYNKVDTYIPRNSDKENTMKYKKGDKLKCVQNPGYKSLTLGKIYVQEQDNDCTDIKDDLGYKTKWHSDMFQLVHEESELERLVRVANEGRTALSVLIKTYPDQTEYSYDECRWHKVNSSTFSQCEIRIKPKPIFEPFKIGSQKSPGTWLVKLDKDDLHVGCHLFNPQYLCSALSDLTRNSSSSQLVDGHKLSSMRDGINCDGKYTISWDDCDLLCRKLEEYLK